MRVKVIAWDIPHGNGSLVLGYFASVRLTAVDGDDCALLLRNDHDQTIAWLSKHGAWMAQGVEWSDITIEPEQERRGL